MEKHPDLILPGKRLGRTRTPKMARRDIIKLAKYLKVERAPKQVDYHTDLLKKIGKFPMLMNDELGDCTCASKGHALQIWNHVAGHDFTPTDEMILNAYEASCGYVVGREETDQGGNMLEVGKYFRTDGIGGHKVLAFAAVDIGDRNEVRLACDLFGYVDFGLDLPLSAQKQESENDVWHVVKGRDAKAGGWGGHDAGSGRYEKDGVKYLWYIATWDEERPTTQQFIDCYADECYAYITEDWLDSQGRSVAGLDIAALRADLEKKIEGPVYALNKYMSGSDAAGACA